MIYSISGIKNTHHTLIIKDDNAEIIIEAQIKLLKIDEIRKLKDNIMDFLESIGFD